MSHYLVSVLYTYIAVFAGYMAAPKDGDLPLGRIAIYWAIVTAFAFFVPYRLPVLLFMGVILAVLGQGSPARAAMLYMAVFLALPDYYKETIPFPGINYLIEINNAKVATIFLLGSIFFAKAFSPAPKRLRAVDNLLLAFVLLTGLMSLRDLPFTSMLRALVNQFLLIYVPYIAISRSLTAQKDVDNALKAFFVATVICVAIGFISLAVHWNYYVNLNENLWFKAFIETRNGLLRIYSVLNTPLLGLCAGIGAICAMSFRADKSIPASVFYLCLAVFALVAFATGSRGGWLAAILTVISYFVFVRMKGGVRKLFLATLAIGVVAMFNSLMQDTNVFDDQYGTYNYRADLLRTSIPQIAQRPIFGSANFLEKPSFQALRQGEGLIDLVNAYLQITLFYGLSGLFLFLGSNLAALKSALRALSLLPDAKVAGEEDAHVRRNLGVLMAMLLGYLGMIATTSGVSYTWNFGYIILALLVAQVRVLDVAKPAVAETPKEEEGEEAPSPVLDSPPPQPVRAPYGARFVRRF